MMFPHTKPPVGTQINPLHPLSNGLVGCWLFNEGAGSLANDISGNKNHGRLTNMAPNVQGSGWGSDGFEVDGDNDYVDISPRLLGGEMFESFTFSAFVCKKGAGISEPYYIFGDRSSDGDIDLVVYDDNHLRLRINEDSTNGAITASGVISDDVFEHIVGVWDGATLYIYINSFLVATSSDSDMGYDAAVGVMIATNPDNTAYLFNGSIRSVSIYNRALSAEAVTWLDREPYAMFKPLFNPALLYSAAPPVGAIMNQFQRANIGADLYNGVFA